VIALVVLVVVVLMVVLRMVQDRDHRTEIAPHPRVRALRAVVSSVRTTGLVLATMGGVQAGIRCRHERMPIPGNQNVDRHRLDCGRVEGAGGDAQESAIFQHVEDLRAVLAIGSLSHRQAPESGS
jgi:hypothetical protein